MKIIIFLTLALGTFVLVACEPADPIQQAAVKLKPAIDAYIYAWNTGDVDTLDTVCDRSIVRYEWSIPTISLDSLKQLIRTERITLSDLKMSIDEEFYVGHHAFLRYTVSGKNSGASFPPAGKSFRMSGMSLFLFTGNKITEVRSGLDAYGFFDQLGFKLVHPAK